MRKIVLSFLLVLSCAVLSLAQLSEEELRMEFDRMEQEMNRALEQLQETVKNGQLFPPMDTTFFHIFPYEGPDEPGFHPQGDPLLLQHLLERFMGQLSPEDWAEIEQLFDEFQQNIPAPDQLEEAPGTEKQSPAKPKRPRKKTKIYSL